MSQPVPTVSNAFERLIAFAASLFDVPIAAVSVVERDKVWCRGTLGLDCGESPVEDSFCRHAVALGTSAVLVVEDTLLDPLFRDKPAVTGEPHLRFYVGATITRRDGHHDGTLCIMDTKPRPRPSDAQLDQLRLLADLAAAQIDLMEHARREAAQVETLTLAETMAGIGNFRLDFATGKVTWSDEVYRIHGVEPGSVDPTLHAAIAAYHPDDAEIVRARIAHSQATGEGYDAQLRLKRADGEDRVTRAIGRCERDETGKVVALFGVFQDITDSVTTQERQTAMVETLKMAGTVAGVGHWRFDVETGSTIWSEEIYKIHGFDPAKPMTLDDVVASMRPEDAMRIHASIEHALATGGGYEGQYRITRPDGVMRITQAKATCELNAKGRVKALFGVLQDVTETVLALEAMAASEVRYRLLAENSTDIIAIYTMAGVFRYLSPAISGLMGYQPEELVGRPFSDFLHPEDVERVQAEFAEYANAGPDAVSPRIAYRGMRKDGETIWLEAHPMVIRDDDGVAIEFQDIVRDITETKRLEEALITARDTAEEAARAKSEFLANMSHELRTPLTSVIGFSGLLKARDDLPEAARKYADRIATASDALLGVINDILDFSKLEADAVGLDSQPFSPRVFAEETTSIIEAQCQKKGIGLGIDIAPDVPAHVMGDEGHLRQVALNYLSNAVKFTAQGEVRLVITRRGDRLRFAVKDTGIGIAAEKIEHVFERFTQADSSTTRVYGGTGLGLAISRRLIEMMDGEVGVVSRQGEGSTFWFEVPMIEVCATDQAFDVPDAALPKGLRILIADDVAANRELASAIVGALGMQMDTVADGSEALEAARSGGYDLILMDVHMPVMDGLEATRTIRGLSGVAGEVPIVALTANVQPGHVERCREAGMDGHVGKPIQISELVVAMSKALKTPRSARRSNAA